VRIIAGTHRGMQLADVGAGDAAAHLRPTSDRVRESLFNVLLGGRYGDPVTGARVLDLFAGTGALGLEALSRGAVQATFVDSGKAAQKLLAANIAKLKRGADARVLTCDAAALPQAEAACTIVFLDPPYGKGMGTPALTAARAKGWIAPGALIVWEESTPQIAPPWFILKDQRRYGDTFVTLMEAQ
jgi:16S rRNA (guanine966-N2)-methyltransferase